MNSTVVYKPTGNPHIWEVVMTSNVSAVYDHFGYVYSNGSSLFSLSVYPTEEAACDALNVYVNRDLYANSSVL